MLTIRPAQNVDIVLLSEYWYDNMALAQQNNPRIRLLPDARRRWENAVRHFIHTNESVFLVAEVEGEVLGCIIGCITHNQAGLAPEFMGIIEWLILDLHTLHKQQGTGRALLQAAKDYFIERNISQLQVSVSVQDTVAQAFWLAVGAKKTDEFYWMNL
jgi:ribosomal protein S18 acetylase RimI-like enzyme